MTTNEKLNHVIKLFEEYQKIPNVPFLTKFTSKFIRHYLDNNSIKYTETPYSIIVNFKPENKEANNKRKIIFMAHLDHPGIVIKNKNVGILMGLNEPKELSTLIDKNPVSIVVYNPKGEFLGKARIKKFTSDNKQRVTIESDFNIPKNSFGQFDVPRFSEDNGKLYAYNADDGIMVNIMLGLVLRKPKVTFDTYFVFNKHEEVLQVSAWNLAKRNCLEISEKDLIINLECLKTESVDTDKYPAVNYEDGPVLQLSNKGCLFGYKNAGKNFAELLSIAMAEKYDLPIQIGLISDSCDSRPFSQFGITSNICTITIPNKYKHDGADDGDIRPEEIYKKDVECVIELLDKILTSDLDADVNKSTKSLSEEVKGSDDVTDKKLMKIKMIVNERLDTAYKNVVKREYFYPKNLFDHISDFALKSLSYISYLINKIR